MVFNIYVLLLFVIGFGLLLAWGASLSGAKFPWVKKHEALTLVVALVFLLVGAAWAGGLFGTTVNNIPTTTTQQVTTTYQITYSLSNIQAASASSNTATTVTLASSLAKINGANGIETQAAIYSTGAFVVGTDHNATIGQAQFQVNLYRTDTNLGNVSFSVTAVNIPTLTNTTTAKTYPLVVQNSGGQYEIYFANNTQTPDIFVHTIAVGGTVSFWVTISYSSAAVDTMLQYQFESFNLDVSFGSGQSLNIPVEIVLTN